MNDLHKDFEKMLMDFYQKGFADCEAAAKKAIEHGIKHAILLEREACARTCDDMSEGLVGDDVSGASGAGYCANAIRARGNK